LVETFLLSFPKAFQSIHYLKMTTNSISTKLHFPARLYQVIEIEDPSVIAWELSGNSFRIVDSKRFRAETIPKYFRRKFSENSWYHDFKLYCNATDGNMASIQRQLNLYGFRCTNRIDEKGVFHHPDFVRGQYDKVRNIRRKKTWPTKRKPKAEAEVAAPTASTSSAPAPLVQLPVRNPGMYNMRQLTPTNNNFFGGDSSYVANAAMFSLNPPLSSDFSYVFSNGQGMPVPVSPCFLPEECPSPLSQLLASDDYMMGIDFFDDKTIDNMMMINNAVLESGDFDTTLLNLFADDGFPDEISQDC
jgi:hypothetical protein